MNYTDPLVPAEVDLRDFAFMPLDVLRLRDSGLTAKATGDQFRAAVLLWCAAWHQVPAASLPDDDDELANICGYSRSRKEWDKVRLGALRGWVTCSDGRLYHRAVATKALEAWIEKLAMGIGGAIGNAKRWNVAIDTHPLRQQFGRAVDALRAIDPQSKTLKKKAVAVLTAPSLPESPPDTPPESPPDSPPDRNRQGQGQGIDKSSSSLPKREPEEIGQPLRGMDGHGETLEPEGKPTAYGAITQALRKAGIQRCNPGHLTFRALVDAGATAEEFLAYVDAALEKRDPFAYLLAVVESARREAKEVGQAVHRGSMAPPNPAAWRDTDLGVRAMAAQLGMTPKSTELPHEWVARVSHTWQRKGCPALLQPTETA